MIHIVGWIECVLKSKYYSFSGMVEAVGNEYMEEYFKCCDSALAENGLFVLQVRICINFILVYQHNEFCRLLFLLALVFQHSLFPCVSVGAICV